MSESLMTPKDVARALAVDLRCLQEWRTRGAGPAYLKLGPKTIRYRRADIDAFIERAKK